MALTVCRRFSASSKTTDCSDSNTSFVTSSSSRPKRAAISAPMAVRNARPLESLELLRQIQQIADLRGRVVEQLEKASSLEVDFHGKRLLSVSKETLRGPAAPERPLIFYLISGFFQGPVFLAIAPRLRYNIPISQKRKIIHESI